MVSGAADGEGGKREELDRVDEGVTGPRDRRDAANWGSEASRLMASSKLARRP